MVSHATAGTQSLSGPFGIAGPEGCGLCIHCEEHPCHDSGPLGHCDMACNGLACSFVQSGTVDFNFEAPFATFIEGDCLTPLSDPVKGTGHRTQSWGLNRLANPKSVLAMHCTWRR